MNAYLKETIKSYLHEIMNSANINEIYSQIILKYNNDYIESWNSFIVSFVNKITFEKLIQAYSKLFKYTRHHILSFSFSPNLSSGQEKLLYTIVNIYNKIIEFDKIGFNKNIFIILDEPEIFLHPDWQKQFNKILIDFLKFKFSDKKFQLIFTTHSPFLLSDIPKENIIFLKDGKNVSDEVDIDTFGANIHTLLSHGFFMEDGLMGEFARKKINEVIKFLNGKDSEIKSKEEAQNIINMIGEPIIKNQLQKMLDSKRLDKIDELEEEIRLLKNRIEILRKNS